MVDSEAFRFRSVTCRIVEDLSVQFLGSEVEFDFFEICRENRETSVGGRSGDGLLQSGRVQYKLQKSSATDAKRRRRRIALERREREKGARVLQRERERALRDSPLFVTLISDSEALEGYRSLPAQGVPDPSSDIRDPRAAPARDLFLVRDSIRQLASDDQGVPDQETKDVRYPIEATRSIPARVPFVSSSR
ncbi:hypothetical protein DY000_02013277 [Brassica cretica]|uniref:IBB domain-containing protein n=1 Tax=Brassica cretica TaxID=69181 RepID=A0ABQ7D1N5_BRACR|nr:hypothetical protein DY000_02013277 [Brassica cretica]